MLIALALVCLMPTNQSLWIDEGFSLSYADEPTASTLAHRILSSPGSEPLMPLGMLSIWAGSKVFGRSELGLRSSSTIWAGIAVLAMWSLGRLVGAPWLVIVFACHPFLWYYASEARPYTMTLALAAGVLCAAVLVLTKPESSSPGILCFLFLGLMLCGGHALASIPFVISAAVVGGVLAHRRWKPGRRELSVSLIPAAMLAILATYYAGAFLKDDGRTWRQQWAFSLDSAAYSAYELLGMSGFGPGRNDLRELTVSGGVRSAIDGLVRPESLGIIALACLYAWILGRWVTRLPRQGRYPRSLTILPLIVVAGTFTVAVIASHIMASPFWGRHLAALVPFITLALALALQDTGSRRPQVPRMAFLVTALLLTSSLMLRFGPSHTRDDYRDAAQLALAEAAAGRTVWWCADPGCAEYYGVDFCGKDDRNENDPCTVYVANQPPGYLPRVPLPDVVVVSKPDLHDKDGLVTDYLASRSFRLTRRLPGFKIYEDGPG